MFFFHPLVGQQWSEYGDGRRVEREEVQKTRLRCSECFVRIGGRRGRYGKYGRKSSIVDLASASFLLDLPCALAESGLAWVVWCLCETTNIRPSSALIAKDSHVKKKRCN